MSNQMNDDRGDIAPKAASGWVKIKNDQSFPSDIIIGPWAVDCRLAPGAEYDVYLEERDNCPLIRINGDHSISLFAYHSAVYEGDKMLLDFTDFPDYLPQIEASQA